MERGKKLSGADGVVPGTMECGVAATELPTVAGFVQRLAAASL